MEKPIEIIRNKSFIKKNAFTAFVFFSIPLWIFFIAPQILKIPKNFTYEASLISVDNFYNESKQSFQGEQYSQSKFSYEVVSKNKNILSIKNTFNVQSLDGKTIFKTEPIYGINARSGEHVKGFGDKDREGYLFGPREIEKGKGFTYWHVSSNEPVPMKFVQEETLYGLKVYKYEKEKITPINQTEFMDFIPGVPEKHGIKLESNIYLWIEPISGYLVKMEDFSTDYYFFDIKTGSKLSPYNQFSNRYSENSVTEHIQIAKNYKDTIYLVQFLIPFFLLCTGLIYFILTLNFTEKIRSTLKKNRIGVILFLVTISTTLVVYTIVNQNHDKEIQLTLSNQAEALKQLIEENFQDVPNILLGAQGLFHASEDVNRDEWHRYVELLNLPVNYPNIENIGFSKIVPEQEKESFTKTAQQKDFPEFLIHPEEKKSAYTPILFLEPSNQQNKNDFGYDISSRDINKKAMEQARDTGKFSATGIVNLGPDNSENSQEGFYIFAPVYRHGIIPETVELREDLLTGFLFITLRVKNLISSILENENFTIDLHVYDGITVNPEKLLFDSDSEEDHHPKISKNTFFRKLDTVYLSYHPWTLEYINAKNVQENKSHARIQWLILIIGSIFSISIFVVFKKNTGAKQVAESFAEQATNKLNENIVNLENSKKAMLNILEDVQSEKDKFEVASKRLQIATESAKIGIWEWDILQNKLTWDTQMYSLYGIKKEKFSGAYDAWQSGLHPDDKKFGDEAIQMALKGEKEFNITFRVVWPNKEIHYIKANAIVERDNDGKALKMVGVNFDITHEKEVDLEKTEFVSLASHQLKTPVSSISWNLELLKSGDFGPLSKDQKKVVSEMYLMNQRMNELINTLLNISRIEMGTLIIEPVPTQLEKLCDEVLVELKSKIQAKKHTITKTYSKTLQSFSADPKLLRIIFQNYISNAIKYTPDNGKIDINIDTNTSDIVFSVSNNGDPIPKQDMNKIFGKLFRASNAQDQDPDGNGLGLYIVKKIVESSGGKVWFESGKGKNTIFYASFPNSGMKKKTGTRTLS